MKRFLIVALVPTVLLVSGCQRPFDGFCGDSVCDPNETVLSCSDDCTSCGDGVCEGDETPANCTDCTAGDCGNGVCDPGESGVTCPGDCPTDCGDAMCSALAGENCTNCPIDCGMCGGCGDGTCDAPGGETCSSCAADCGACPTPEDTSVLCSDLMDNDGDMLTDCADPDCAPFCAGCGDGTCDVSETCSSCAADCGVCCGNGVCDVPFGEDCVTCSVDCGLCACGDGTCDAFAGETCTSCPGDCSCGTDTCQDAYICALGCSPLDTFCVQTCYDQACAAGQAELQPLIDCGTMMCFVECSSSFIDPACTMCIMTQCATELAACSNSC